MTTTPVQQPGGVRRPSAGAPAAKLASHTGPAPGTRGLLAAGAVAGPVMAAAWVVQGSVRDGYDFTRHPMSLLAVGDGGWVQIANFVVTGLLVIAGAAGMRQVMAGAPGGTWAPRLAALIGLGLIAAGAFTVDPGSGFPAGAPEGNPEMSLTGALHGVSLLVNVVGFVAGALVLRHHFADRGDHAWARGSVAVIPVVTALFAVPHAPSLPTRLVALTVVILGYLNLSARRAARPWDPTIR